MNDWKYKSVLLAAMLLLPAIPAVDAWIGIDYLFAETFDKHRHWFPTFYPLTFAFFQLVFPVLYGTVWFLFLPKAFPAAKKWLPAIIGLQSIALVYLLHKIGFWFVAWDLLPLPLMALVYTLFPGSFLSLQNLRLSGSTRKKMGGIALFVLYIGLSLFFKNAHPFAEYSMFNHFSGHTTSFLLRDNDYNLVPLNEYSSYTGNELFEQYVAINKKHGFIYNNTDALPSEQSMVYDEMVQQIFSHLKKNFPSDSVRLMRVDFSLSKNKPVIHERQVKIRPTH